MDQTTETLSLDNIDFNGSLEKIAENLPLTLFVLGPPGSGKSTTTKLFFQLLSSTRYFGQKTPNVLLINTGELLRSFANSNENAEILRQPILSNMRDGRLVSEASKIFVWYREINQFLKNCPDGSLIFDGSPRNENERRILFEFLFEIGRKPLLIEILISEEELRRRLLLRKEDRPDDHEDGIKNRLKDYMDITKVEIGRMSHVIPVERLEAKFEECSENVLRRFVQRVRSGLNKINGKKAGN